jgi:hypothetical protein
MLDVVLSTGELLARELTTDFLVRVLDWIL